MGLEISDPGARASAAGALGSVDERDAVGTDDSRPNRAALAPTPGERRAALARVRTAVAAVEALDPLTQGLLGEGLVEVHGAGMPIAPFLGIRAEADCWASFANLPELKCYLIAAWLALPPVERRKALPVLQRSV